MFHYIFLRLDKQAQFNPYPENVENMVLLIIPADGRWDLIRHVKVNLLKPDLPLFCPLRCRDSISMGLIIVNRLCRGQLKYDGTRAETRFRLSAKRTSPFISAGASVQSTTGSRGVHISGSNAGYTMFRGSVKVTGYPLHSPVSRSLPLPCVNVCHHIST